MVKDFFDCEYRGKVPAKHKGEIDMYFVNGIRRELSIDGAGKAPAETFFHLYRCLEQGVGSGSNPLLCTHEAEVVFATPPFRT